MFGKCRITTLPLVFSLIVILTGCPEPDNDGVFSLYEILDLSTDVAQVLQNENGEQLVVLAEKDAGGDVEDVIGGGCFTPEGIGLIFWFGDDGLPLYAVAGGYLFHFYNYTSDTVDVIVTAPDATSYAMTGVDISAGQVTECLQQALAKADGDLWRWVSSGIGITGCAVSLYATTQQAGLMLYATNVGCAGTALGIIGNVLQGTGGWDFGAGVNGTTLDGVSTTGSCLNVAGGGTGCALGQGGLAAAQIAGHVDEAEDTRNSVVGGEEGGLRFVLTWGEYPADLDSHLWTPSIDSTSHHIYYATRNSYSVDISPYADLDVDDLVSYGPETVTIARLFPGTYEYWVYNWSGHPDITTSEAHVAVYDAHGLIGQYSIPTSGTGRWWHVCNVDGSTGIVTGFNTIHENEPYKDFDAALMVK